MTTRSDVAHLDLERNIRQQEGGVLDARPPIASHLDLLIVVAVLVLTALTAIGCDLFRMLDHDEFLSLYTDSQKYAGDIVRVQLISPISLDPPVYHLLSHASMSVLGNNAFAERLPSMLGFMLMQVFIYFFLRRVVVRRAALVGALLPLATATFSMTLEGRPYGLLAGLAAVSLVCWQSIARDTRKQLIYLLALAISLVLVVSTHFFGLLVLLPVTVAEFVRIKDRGRVDWGVFSAIAIGFFSLVMILPFRKAVQIYQVHYWAVSNAKLRDIPQNYAELIVSSGGVFVHAALGIALILILLVALVYVTTRQVGRAEKILRSEVAAITTLILLPAIGTILGTFVTHTFQARYAIEGSIGIVLLLVLTTEKWLIIPKVSYATVGTLAFLSILFMAYRAYREYRATRQVEATLAQDPIVSSHLTADTNAPIYIQNADEFFRASYYLRDDDIRSRLKLLYGPIQELRLHHTDTGSITAVNLERISSLKSASFDSFCNGQPHLLLTSGDSWEWIGEELQQDGARIKPIGPYLGAELEEVVCQQH